MNSGVVGYQLQTFTGLIAHSWQEAFFLRDMANEQDEVDQLEVQVRSGDYFITLATTLDQLGREVTDYHVRLGLEDAVSDLIHLQDNYIITKDKQKAEQ